MPSGLTFETKAIAGINNVAHKTQVAESAALSGVAKVEWQPTFTVAGKPLLFSLSATDSSFLLGPSKFSGVIASAKIKPTSRSSLTAKYALDKKIPAVVFKLDADVADRILETEIGWTKGSEVTSETEYHIDSLTKLQVETLGAKLSAVKATRTRGKNQLKLKYNLLTEAPIIGLDTYLGGNKWDFEYNVKTERLDAKVKVYPVTLAAATYIGKSGVGKGGISYKLTGEKTVSF